MKECLLCEKDMKRTKNNFGQGCIKKLYEFENLEIPKKEKNKEKYFCKYILKKLNATNLNEEEKICLVDRYLTRQYVSRLRYGDYVKEKMELDLDIQNIIDKKNFKRQCPIKLKEAYSTFNKEETLYKYMSKEDFKKDLDDVTLRMLLDKIPVSLVIRKNASPFEQNALGEMQFIFWQLVVFGGKIFGYKNAANLLEHSLKNKSQNIIISDDNIIDEIKNDQSFKQKINEVIKKYGKNKNSFHYNSLKDDSKKNGLIFKNGDLYFAIHNVDIIVDGKKENNTWNLSVTLYDKYDYTDFKKYHNYYKDTNSIPKSMLSSFLYNLAYFSVKMKIMHEYKIYITFEMTIGEL